MKAKIIFLVLLAVCLITVSCTSNKTMKSIQREDFGWNWMFHLGDTSDSLGVSADSSTWQIIDLPHDWSILGDFNKDNPATPGGGALPAV